MDRDAFAQDPLRFPAEPLPESLLHSKALRARALQVLALLALAFLFQACGTMVGEFFPTAQAAGQLDQQIAGTNR